MAARMPPAPRAARPTLGQGFDPHWNSLGFLRLTLAVVVVAAHALLVGGWMDPVLSWSGSQENLGGVAVDGFFAISGFLLLRSWQRAPSLGHFLWRRGLRLAPAYWAALLLVAFGWAPLWWWMEHGSLSGELLSGPEGVLSYLRLGFYFDHEQERGIAGLLGAVPTPHWVNTPLWSLRYEVLCCLWLGALGWLGLLSRERPRVLAIHFGVLWGLHTVEVATTGAGVRMLGGIADAELLRLAAFFFAGACFSAWRDEVPLDGRLFAACAVALGFALRGGGFQPVAVVALPYAVLYLACTLPLARFEAHGDFSYGLYVFTFPIQQTLALLGVQERGLAAFVALSLLGGLALAVLSYRFVESPFLSIKRE